MIGILFIFTILLSFVPLVAQAQSSLLPLCIHSGNCGFCDIVDVVGRLFRFVLYFLGIAAVAVFSWGSFDLISSRGNPEKLEKGKETVKGVLWGVLFVLIAWQMANMTLFIMGTQLSKRTYDPALAAPMQGRTIVFKLFGNPWNYICEPESIGNVAQDKELAAAQRVCFSRGDGTPCSTTALGGTIIYGICEEGKCTCPSTEVPTTAEDQAQQPPLCPEKEVGGTRYSSSCHYLADRFKAHFGKRRGYIPGETQEVTLSAYTCVEDPQRKGDQTPQQKEAKEYNDLANAARATNEVEYFTVDCIDEPNICPLSTAGAVQECCGVVQVGN